MHFDGDSFFASVEVAMDHTLRGLPVVTGAERGAATSMSYEAKRMGVARSMTLKQIRACCPNVVVVNSNYTAYSIYARRMYAIVRRFTPEVEEYSIDECFADITGLDEVYGKTYERIAQDIKRELEGKLGITFGVGLGPSKVLAKTASKHRKPAGFTVITAHTAKEFLADMPIGKIWGIGPAMTLQFAKLGIATAGEFAAVSPEWLRNNHIGKGYVGIWHELRGSSVNPVSTEPRRYVGSIIKSRTFSPPSTDKAFVYSQLCKNVERACARAREQEVSPRGISFFLKTQGFLYGRRELLLPCATADPLDLLEVIAPEFETLYQRGVQYRATGVTLRSIVDDEAATSDLFGRAQATRARSPLLNAVDKLNHRFGGQTVHVAASLTALRYHEPDRSRRRKKNNIKMPAAYRAKSINLPFLGVAR